MTVEKKEAAENDLILIVEEGIRAWHLKNSKKGIQEQVKSKLDKNFETIFMKLVGFDNRWGKWEVDHCNGRAGQSVAGDRITACAQKAVDDFFASCRKPELSATTKKQIETSIQKTFEDKVQSLLRAKIESFATARANAIVEELTSTINVDDYLAVKELIVK